MNIDSAVVLDILKSLIVLIALLITRTLVVRWISRNPTLSMEAKRRWVVTTRNWIVFAFLIGLVSIWAHELQAFAVSLVALAAALVLICLLILAEPAVICLKVSACSFKARLASLVWCSRSLAAAVIS